MRCQRLTKKCRWGESAGGKGRRPHTSPPPFPLPLPWFLMPPPPLIFLAWHQGLMRKCQRSESAGGKRRRPRTSPFPRPTPSRVVFNTPLPSFFLVRCWRPTRKCQRGKSAGGTRRPRMSILSLSSPPGFLMPLPISFFSTVPETGKEVEVLAGRGNQGNRGRKRGKKTTYVPHPLFPLSLHFSVELTPPPLIFSLVKPPSSAPARIWRLTAWECPRTRPRKSLPFYY